MSDFILTIVTVTKNCVQTINKTLASVRAIKVPKVEYIVIDGVSVDGTLGIIKNHIDIVDHLLSEPDDGIYNAMNKGVALARGRYVLFINGDDELLDDGFPETLQVLERSMKDIICATTLVGCRHSPDEILIARPVYLPFYNSVPHPSSFVARELLVAYPFQEDLFIAADYDFFLHAYVTGKEFYVLPEVVALHQRGGASGNIARSRQELEKVRRQRLGLQYPLYNILAVFHKTSKRLLKYFQNE